MVEIELGESEEDEEWENNITFTSRYNTRLTYHGFMLVLYFDVSDIFFVPIFVLDFF